MSAPLSVGFSKSKNDFDLISPVVALTLNNAASEPVSVNVPPAFAATIASRLEPVLLPNNCSSSFRNSHGVINLVVRTISRCVNRWSVLRIC